MTLEEGQEADQAQEIEGEMIETGKEDPDLTLEGDARTAEALTETAEAKAEVIEITREKIAEVKLPEKM